MSSTFKCTSFHSRLRVRSKKDTRRRCLFVHRLLCWMQEDGRFKQNTQACAFGSRYNLLTPFAPLTQYETFAGYEIVIALCNRLPDLDHIPICCTCIPSRKDSWERRKKLFTRRSLFYLNLLNVNHPLIINYYRSLLIEIRVAYQFKSLIMKGDESQLILRKLNNIFNIFNF